RGNGVIERWLIGLHASNLSATALCQGAYILHMARLVRPIQRRIQQRAERCAGDQVGEEEDQEQAGRARPAHCLLHGHRCPCEIGTAGVVRHAWPPRATRLPAVHPRKAGSHTWRGLISRRAPRGASGVAEARGTKPACSSTLGTLNDDWPAAYVSTRTRKRPAPSASASAGIPRAGPSCSPARASASASTPAATDAP